MKTNIRLIKHVKNLPVILKVKMSKMLITHMIYNNIFFSSISSLCSVSYMQYEFDVYRS